jgi:hypothetical protein
MRRLNHNFSHGIPLDQVPRVFGPLRDCATTKLRFDPLQNNAANQVNR